jgi:Ca-activated chloride channel family protein
MKTPVLNLTPAYSAVSTAAETMLDVLLRVVPPDVERSASRPALNLGVVLDRSGSMNAAGKMPYALEAAILVVQELSPTDWFSLTIFDNEVEALIPSTQVHNKASLIAAIRQVHPRGSTALHAGWQEGARQVEQRYHRGALNRVLLLSDGLANVGEISPDAIASDVAKFRARGVTTTTIGLGDDYSEDLLTAMAAAGDGNYYHVKSPAQLVSDFAIELEGLTATMGENVRLRIEPSPGVEVVDVLNDFERDEAGQHKLANLVAGMPLEALVRFRVAPTRTLESRELCDFALTWNSPNHAQPQLLHARLALPVVSVDSWSRLTPDPQVEECALLLSVARLKLQYARSLDAMNIEASEEALKAANQLLDQMPNTPSVVQERNMLAQLQRAMEEGHFQSSSKMAKFNYYRRRHSKPME